VHVQSPDSNSSRRSPIRRFGSAAKSSGSLVLASPPVSALIANSFAHAAPAIAILLSGPILAQPITPTLLGAAALALVSAALMGERSPWND
jgi:hypothetical protein